MHTQEIPGIPLWRRWCTTFLIFAYINAFVVPTPIKASEQFELAFEAIRPVLKVLDDDVDTEGAPSPLALDSRPSTPRSFLSSVSVASEDGDGEADAEPADPCESPFSRDGSEWEIFIKDRAAPFALKLGERQTLSLGRGHTATVCLTLEGLEVYDFRGTILRSSMAVFVPEGGAVLAREVHVGKLTLAGSLAAHELHADCADIYGSANVDVLEAARLVVAESGVLAGLDDGSKAPEDRGVRSLRGGEATLNGRIRVQEADITRVEIGGQVTARHLKGTHMHVQDKGVVTAIEGEPLQLSFRDTLRIARGGSVSAEDIVISENLERPILNHSGICDLGIYNAGTLTATRLSARFGYMVNLESGQIVGASTDGDGESERTSVTLVGQFINKGRINASDVILDTRELRMNYRHIGEIESLYARRLALTGTVDRRNFHHRLNDATGNIQAEQLTLRIDTKSPVENHGTVDATSLHVIPTYSGEPTWELFPGLVKNYGTMGFMAVEGEGYFPREADRHGYFPERVIEALGGASRIHLPMMPAQIPGNWRRHGHVVVDTLAIDLATLIGGADEAEEDPWAREPLYESARVPRVAIAGVSETLPGVFVTEELWADVGDATELTTPLQTSARLVLHRHGADVKGISTRTATAYGLAHAQMEVLSAEPAADVAGLLPAAGGAGAPAEEDAAALAAAAAAAGGVGHRHLNFDYDPTETIAERFGSVRFRAICEGPFLVDRRVQRELLLQTVALFKSLSVAQADNGLGLVGHIEAVARGRLIHSFPAGHPFYRAVLDEMGIPTPEERAARVAVLAAAAAAREADPVRFALKASTLDPEGMAAAEAPEFHIKADIRAGKGVGFQLLDRKVRIGDEAAATYPRLESGAGPFSLLAREVAFESGLIAAVHGGGIHTTGDQHLGGHKVELPVRVTVTGQSRDIPTRQIPADKPTTIFSASLFCNSADTGSIDEQYLQTWARGSQSIYANRWSIISSQHHIEAGLMGKVKEFIINAEDNGDVKQYRLSDCRAGDYWVGDKGFDWNTTLRSVFELHGPMGMQFEDNVSLGYALLGSDFTSQITASSPHARITLNAHNGGLPLILHERSAEYSTRRGRLASHQSNIGTLQTEFSSASGVVFSADALGLGGVVAAPRIAAVHEELVAIGGRAASRRPLLPFVRVDAGFDPTSPLVETDPTGSILHRLRYPMHGPRAQINWPFFYRGRFSHTQPEGVPLFIDPAFLGLRTGQAINAAGFPGMHIVFGQHDTQANLLGQRAHALVDTIAGRAPALVSDRLALTDAPGDALVSLASGVSTALARQVPELLEQPSGWWVYDEELRAMVPVISTTPWATDLGHGRRATELLVPDGEDNFLALIPRSEGSRALIRAIHTRAPRTLLTSGEEIAEAALAYTDRRHEGVGRHAREIVEVTHVGSLHETTGPVGPIIVALGRHGRIHTHGPVELVSPGAPVLAAPQGIIADVTEDHRQITQRSRRHQMVRHEGRTRGITLGHGTPGLMVMTRHAELAGLDLQGGTLGLLTDDADLSGTDAWAHEMSTHHRRGAWRDRVTTRNEGHRSHASINGHVISLGEGLRLRVPGGHGADSEALVPHTPAAVLALADHRVRDALQPLRELLAWPSSPGLRRAEADLDDDTLVRGFVGNDVADRLMEIHRGGVGNFRTTRTAHGTTIVYPADHAPHLMPVYDASWSEVHTHTTMGWGTRTLLTAAVQALVPTIPVSGFGSFMGAAGLHAATGFGTNVALGSIDGGGLHHGWREATRGRALRMLAASSLASAGASWATHAAGLPTRLTTFNQHLAAAAIRVPLTMVGQIVGGADIHEALRDGGVSLALAPAASYGAFQIGELGADLFGSTLLHGVSSAAVGGVRSALLGRDIGSGMLSGATGGMVAHLAAAAMINSNERPEDATGRAALSSLAGTLAGGLLGGDPTAAALTANSVVTYNDMAHLGVLDTEGRVFATEEERAYVEALETEIGLANLAELMGADDTPTVGDIWRDEVADPTYVDALYVDHTALGQEMRLIFDARQDAQIVRLADHLDTWNTGVALAAQGARIWAYGQAAVAGGVAGLPGGLLGVGVGVVSGLGTVYAVEEATTAVLVPVMAGAEDYTARGIRGLAQSYGYSAYMQDQAARELAPRTVGALGGLFAARSMARSGLRLFPGRSLGDGLRSSKYVVVRGPDGRISGVEGFQLHHVISNKHPLTMNHPLLKLAGYDLQDSGNLILLPTLRGVAATGSRRSIHQGRHSNIISRRLAQRMKDVHDLGRVRGYTRQQYHAELMKILRAERLQLKSGARKLNKHYQAWAMD